MKGSPQKQALVDSAVRLFHEQGFGATGAREIATAAGVPVGSFTNHYRSKEALGVAALDQYVERLTALMNATLGDVSRPPEQRLKGYFDLVAERLAEGNWRTGCIIPDFATEIVVCGEALRSRLLEVMNTQVAAFGEVFAQLRFDDADDVAAFVVAAWHGTLLRMKVERGPEPLNRFRRVLRVLVALRLPDAHHAFSYETYVLEGDDVGDENG